MWLAEAAANHGAVFVARDNKVANIRVMLAGTLQDRNPFGTVTRTRERNPNIFFPGNQPIVHMSQEIGTGYRDHFALPALTQKMSQALANVIGSPGADKENRGP